MNLLEKNLNLKVFNAFNFILEDLIDFKKLHEGFFQHFERQI